MSAPEPPRGWTLIVPVKETALAKTRLRGFSDVDRRRLAVSFALDAVAVALTCDQVCRVVVVTNDPVGTEFAAAGADVIPDHPDAGLNPALVHAAHEVRRHDATAALAAMSGDLPSLRAADLRKAFAAANAARWFVSDASGDGTTLLAAAPDQRLFPSFGTHSAAAHRASGAAELAIAGLDGLRRDVDTDADLLDAVRLGVGSRTRAVLADLQVVGLA